jgi:elongation factor P--(R)-beta-lysine ligase
MKDLLSNHSGDIYFLGHVFRKEEIGSLHNSEFTMLEYYFTNTSEEIFIENTIAYLSLFLGEHNIEILTYQEAVAKYTPKDYIPPNNFNEDEKRHYLFSHHIEQNLGIEAYTIIKDFPEAEASLAEVQTVNGKRVAKRYEIFFDKTELGNGFKELACAKTAEKRFLEANEKRKVLGKETYPLDKVFLQHLKQGLPENTYGIAIGFDRLLMLSKKLSHINQIIL